MTVANPNPRRRNPSFLNSLPLKLFDCAFPEYTHILKMESIFNQFTASNQGYDCS